MTTPTGSVPTSYSPTNGPDDDISGLTTALIACMFGLLWFAFPLTRR